MIKKAAEAFDTFEDQDAAPIADTVVAGHVPPHFLDSDRVNLYLTLAGLLEAAIPAETALMLLETEAKAQNQKHNAERIAEFFQAVRAARKAVTSADENSDGTLTDIIGESAENCFGRGFVSSDEMVLLRGLAYTDNVPAILKAAADVVKNRSLAYSPTRPTVQKIGRRFK